MGESSRHLVGEIETSAMDFSVNETINLLNKSLIKTVNKTRLWSKGPRNNNDITSELSISLYSVIFVLSVTGNVLVILTLIREKKMRTITNMFLLNLAISDMLLSVLCMPFTLVSMLLRNFIFGEVMCILIRYFQGKERTIFNNC